MPLAPPPDGAMFPTWAECLRSVQTLAASEGYAVNAKGQARNKDTGLYRRYVIRCDKSGTFKSAAQIGIRRMSSKKTDCPFSAACNIRPDGCYLRVLVPEHNHPPSELPAAHVQHRKLTDEQRRLVEARAVERKSVKLIWEELKSLDPNTYITFKDVDNAVQRFRKKAKDGATGVQAIMYKLVERQDLFCFTLEKEGTLQGAFWVPRWSTDLWMRPGGTPDILVMLADHIANRPVLPILEMNSVLNTAGFGSAPPTRALPNDPTNTNADGSLNPALDPASDPNMPPADNNHNIEPSLPNPILPLENVQNVPGELESGNPAFDHSLGAGYAILPDKSNATILWLRSAVEMLRQRIPQCPRPRFLTLTDFQTAEKNILVEVSKGGSQHRQMHVVFGRVLTPDEDVVHHGVRSRRPRTDGDAAFDPELVGGPDDIMEDTGEPDGEHPSGENEQLEMTDRGDGEDGHEDQDMDGDHDSDAEIARQLTGGHLHHDGRDPHNLFENRGPNQESVYPPPPEPNLGHAQQQLSHAQDAITDPNSMSTRPTLPLPHPTTSPGPALASGHLSARAPPAQMGYDLMTPATQDSDNMTSKYPPPPI